MKILLHAAVGLTSCMAAFPALAQAYPERPVKIVVEFAPGGSSDAVARLLPQRLAPVLGQTVVVENK